MTGPRAALRAWASSLVLLISLAIVCPTHAQEAQQTALARTLFEEGVARADRGDWVGAADRFARAYTLKPTSGIAFNWASALMEVGKLLEAQELLLRIVRETSSDAELRKQSELSLAAIDERIARIRVRVVGDVSDSARLEVDGVAWPRAAWDVTSPIDPGRHLLVLKSDGKEHTRIELTLTEGDARELVMNTSGPTELTRAPRPFAASSRADRPPAQLVALRPAAEAPTQVDDDRARPLRRSWMLWTAVGVVVAGGVVTAVLLTRDREEVERDPVMGNAGVIRW
jgi:hypothetical protein